MMVLIPLIVFPWTSPSAMWCSPENKWYIFATFLCIALLWSIIQPNKSFIAYHDIPGTCSQRTFLNSVLKLLRSGCHLKHTILLHLQQSSRSPHFYFCLEKADGEPFQAVAYNLNICGYIIWRISWWPRCPGIMTIVFDKINCFQKLLLYC